MRFRISFPDRKRLLGSRWVRPFAHRLGDPRLWHLNRESAARGLALGLFVGLLIPLGQTPLAALLAVPIRAHLLVAAAATFVTNPLTFPIIYLAALRWGETLLSATHFGASGDGSESLLERTVALAGPLAAGLLCFATLAGAFGYVGVKFAWRVRTARRWRKRNCRKLQRRSAPN